MLTNLSLCYLKKELSFLEGSYFQKIQVLFLPTKKKILKLKFHSKDGVKSLLLVPRKAVFETFFPLSGRQNNLTEKINKLIGNKRVLAFRQIGHDRILSLDFEGFRLLLEFYPQGDFLLLSEDNKVLAALSKKKLLGKVYSPKPALGFPESFEDFKKQILEHRQLKDVFPGFHLKEALEILDMKNLAEEAPSKIDEKTLRKIFSKLRNFLTLKQELKPEIKNEKLFLFVGRQKEKLSRVLDDFFILKLQKYKEKETSLLEKQKSREIRKLSVSLEREEKRLRKFLEEKTNLRKKGDLIYRHFLEIDELLASIKQMEKIKNIEEREAIYNKLKTRFRFLRDFDKNKRTLTLEFPD